MRPWAFIGRTAFCFCRKCQKIPKPHRLSMGEKSSCTRSAISSVTLTICTECTLRARDPQRTICGEPGRKSRTCSASWKMYTTGPSQTNPQSKYNSSLILSQHVEVGELLIPHNQPAPTKAQVREGQSSEDPGVFHMLLVQLGRGNLGSWLLLICSGPHKQQQCALGPKVFG